MDTIYSVRPFAAILVSFLLVPLLLLTRKKPNIRETFTFAAAILKFLIIASMVPAILHGASIEYTIAEVLPGIPLRLRVDAFGMLFALVASFLWIVTSVYSVGYMRGLKEHSQTRYFCFFALSLCAAVGAAFSANLLTLYMFYEMLSFATYPLVTHHQDAEARSAGRKYLLYIVGTSIGFVLPAMVFTYHLTGTLAFGSGGIIPDNTPPCITLILLCLFLFGFAKAGIMPFHSWLPAAMVAPTPVSALLHAVAVVKVGAFCVVRIMIDIFGTRTLSHMLTPGAFLPLNTLVGIIASVTIIGASLIALSQNGLKRRLAFSTIGQLSYIVLGAALLSPQGITGGMLHIAMHAFGKITLFFCAGAIFVATGIRNISEMDGIGKRMPITMTAFFIGALSVIGIPPCGGFISKWHLVFGTIQAEQWGFMVVILTSSLLNAAYFLPIVYRAFFCPPEASKFENRVAEAPIWCLLPLKFTAFASIILFFYPQPFLKLAQLAVRHLAGGI